MARKKEKKKETGSPSWMVTYSDMVTLLLTFFVLLISMSEIDVIKFSRAAGSLKGAFGVFEEVGDEEIHSSLVTDIAPIRDERVQRVYQRLKSQLERLELNEDIELVKDRGAVILRVNESILFSSGETKAREKAFPILRNVANLVRPWPFNLRIEGHTDDVPVMVQTRTNWDLSIERAVSVLKFFAQEDLIPLNRLSAVGYGSQHPIVPNDSKKHRAMNRRVDFVLESTSGYQKELPYLIDTKYQLPF